MTDIRTRLLEDDPLRDEPTLEPQLAQAMRRHVVTRRATADSPAWTRTMTLATALACLVAIGIGVTRRGQAEEGSARAPSDRVAQQDADTSRRQLQFATPGGTRVIWTFNDRFETEVR